MVAAIAAATMLASSIYFIKVALPKAQVARGHVSYLKTCASCHGKNLEGQPDWKSPNANGRMPAPPHDATGHTWHHGDDDLTGIIKFGLKPYVSPDYESDMPAYKDVLADNEISDIIAYVKSTWPERESAYQAQITLQNRAAKK